MTRDTDVMRTRRLTRDEAADYLRCAPRTMRWWAAQGIGPRFAIVAGRALYAVDDLEAYIAEHTVDVGGDAA